MRLESVPNPMPVKNGWDPNDPNALEIGPPHDAMNLIRRVKTPAVSTCRINSRGPSAYPNPPVNVVAVTLCVSVAGNASAR